VDFIVKLPELSADNGRILHSGSPDVFMLYASDMYIFVKLYASRLSELGPRVASCLPL